MQINIEAWLQSMHFDAESVMRVVNAVVGLQQGPALTSDTALRHLQCLGAFHMITQCCRIVWSSALAHQMSLLSWTSIHS